jgi:DsbC/DsbD-like thiol-disulfide interchange protein
VKSSLRGCLFLAIWLVIEDASSSRDLQHRGKFPHRGIDLEAKDPSDGDGRLMHFHLVGSRAAVAAVLAGFLIPYQSAIADELVSPWVEGFNYKVRMSGGRSTSGAHDGPYAFIEVAMTKGWKTYWRNPGDAGGIPPAFDWSKSQNLGEAHVLFPVPHRLTDRAGDTIGYKEHVIFPVRLTAMDVSKPIALNLQMAFGVCEKLCVPADASLALQFPISDLALASADALAALSQVPRGGASAGAEDPSVMKITQELTGARPRLVFEVKVPGDAAAADMFLEAPGGLYIPLPRRVEGGSGDVVRFESDLSKDVDLAALKGKSLTATVAGSKGQSEHIFTID